MSKRRTLVSISILIVSISITFYVHYNQAIELTSRMIWKHTGTKIINGKKHNLIRFTCESNRNKGIVAAAFPHGKLLSHLKQTGKSVVSVKVMTDGYKLIRPDPSYVTSPSDIEGGYFSFVFVMPLHQDNHNYFVCRN